MIDKETYRDLSNLCKNKRFIRKFFYDNIDETFTLMQVVKEHVCPHIGVDYESLELKELQELAFDVHSPLKSMTQDVMKNGELMDQGYVFVSILVPSDPCGHRLYGITRDYDHQFATADYKEGINDESHRLQKKRIQIMRQQASINYKREIKRLKEELKRAKNSK